MRLSSMADYAVVVMAALARHCGTERVSASVVAAETSVPMPTVQKLVSRLAAAGLVRSSRGSGGGVMLARPAAAITLADIVEAIDGPIALTSCIEGEACAVDHACSVKPHWPVVNAALRGALEDVKLTELARIEIQEQELA